MSIESMLDMLLVIKNINYFIDLVGVCTSERYYFIVLGHFAEEVFGVRSEDMAF